jgi:sulfite reductase (NADPH) flavoprotein alpha-component
MSVPVLPDTAPFSPAQRAWLNGFFAGMLSGNKPSANVGSEAVLTGSPLSPSYDAFSLNPSPAPNAPSNVILFESADGDFAWHDPTLAMDERMNLAEGKPFDLRLMAAMAQLDCGTCGYLCRTYAEAIATGADADLSKCVPGGKETSKKLKALVAAQNEVPSATQNEVPSATAATASPPAAPAPVNESAAGGAGASWNRVEPLKVAPVTAHQETLYDRRNPYPSRILDLRRLTGESSQKDVRFVSLDLKGSGMTYEAGDSLGVYPENCPELVEEILRLLSATGEEPVISPEGWVVPARIALAKAYVITECGEDLLTLLAGCAIHPEEKNRLHALARGDDDDFLFGRDALDLLKAFPSARTTVRELIPSLAPLRPRLYSISSSPKAYPDEVHLTVGVVRYQREGCDRMRKGVASTFLSERTRIGDKAAVFVQPSHGFRPPEDDRPMIMVGPGTGIAPFRAFLQERQAQGAKGKNWLFFGDQRSASDFLYREEMEKHMKDGLLSQLDLAFSRDQDEKIYVQRRMMDNAERIWDWLQDGANFYVCGDAQRMAKDVDATLHKIVAQYGKLSDAEAKTFITTLVKERRYQRDVY